VLDHLEAGFFKTVDDFLGGCERGETVSDFNALLDADVIDILLVIASFRKNTPLIACEESTLLENLVDAPVSDDFDEIIFVFFVGCVIFVYLLGVSSISEM